MIPNDKRIFTGGIIMREIRKLKEEDLSSFANILFNAYPAVYKSSADALSSLQKSQENDRLAFYGLFEDKKLLGGMRLHFYEMNMYGAIIPVAGVGSVAVDLLHKKEKVAKDLIEFFIDHCNQLGIHMLALYPFRPDFYKQMGFGIGCKMEQYRIVPTSLPKGDSKQHIRYLNIDDKERLHQCHQQFVQRTHGMFFKTEMELNSMFSNPNLRIVGYEKNGEIQGYITFSFRKVSEDSFLRNNIHIHEMIYLNPSVLKELFTFLRSQADQIERIIIQTQDPYFHHIFSDPQNGSGRLIPSVYHESNTAGVGLMYRVNNVKPFMEQILQHRNFGQQSLTLKLTITDTLYPKNDGSTIFRFEHGCIRPVMGDSYDVEIKLDISDFSSMIMGVIPFRKLYEYGLAYISNEEALTAINQLFYSYDKPVCMSAF